MEHNLDKLKERLLPLYVNLRKDCNADENLCPFLMQWGDKFPIKELSLDHKSRRQLYSV